MPASAGSSCPPAAAAEGHSAAIYHLCSIHGRMLWIKHLIREQRATQQKCMQLEQQQMQWEREWQRWWDERQRWQQQEVQQHRHDKQAAWTAAFVMGYIALRTVVSRL